MTALVKSLKVYTVYPWIMWRVKSTDTWVVENPYIVLQSVLHSWGSTAQGLSHYTIGWYYRV